MKFFYTLLWSFFSITTFAQSTDSTEFKPYSALGIKGSFHASMVFFSPQIPQTPFLGYGGGLAFKHVSEKHLGILVECNYAPKGWEENRSDGVTYSRRFHYLEVPFMTHIYTGKKRAHAMLNFGPLFSFMLQEQENLPADNTTWASYYAAPIQNRFELGMVIGAGFLYTGQTGDFLFEVRYGHNLLNFFNQETFTLSQNQSATASISYLFAFGQKDEKPQKMPKPKKDKKRPQKERSGTETPNTPQNNRQGILNNGKIRSGTND